MNKTTGLRPITQFEDERGRHGIIYAFRDGDKIIPPYEWDKDEEIKNYIKEGMGLGKIVSVEKGDKKYVMQMPW